MAAEDEGPQHPPLVTAAAEAFRGVHKDTTAHALEARSAWLSEWLESFEREHSGFMGELLADIVNHPDLPEPIRNAMHQLTGPEHQTQVLLGLFSVGSIVMRFVGAAIGPYAQDVENLAWSERPVAPLSPDVAAVAVLKGWKTEGEGATEAALSGIDADRFDTLTKVTGNPPGPVELMEALRREIIDQARFAQGIRESRVRPEWIDVLTALRFSPLPFGTIVAAAIQGHITLPELGARMTQVGYHPDQAELVYETAGRPPGVFELGELVNRGEMPQDLWEQAIRESDIKNKYIPYLAKLRRKIPPMRTVVAAVHQGVLAPDKGIEKLMELGYDHSDAAMLVGEATALKHSANKNLAIGMVRNLYAERLITRPQAHTMFTNLGYDESEVGFILALADHDRQYRFQAASITHVHTRYVSHKIDAHAARAALNKLTVEPDAIDDFLTLWTDERVMNAPTLSLSQWQGAIRRGDIGQARFKAECEKLGYADNVIPFLYSEAWPPTQEPPKWTLGTAN